MDHTEREEDKIHRLFVEKTFGLEEILELYSEQHVEFLMRALNGLKSGFVGLDASQTWLLYWVSNSLAILNSPIILSTEEHFDISCIILEPSDILARQRAFQADSGGFAGGELQLPHLAPTFSAILSIVLTRTYDVIDRPLLKRFIMSLKQPDGSFIMHEGGESDLRASYCATVAAYICNILDDSLCENVGEFIASCQTFEGGFGAVPGNEAHGGYTFCGFAALILIDKIHLIDLDALERWTVRKVSQQGGFAGRTNKLVDSCYCYWIYALVLLIEYAKNRIFTEPMEVIDRRQLLNYLLNFSQVKEGGFCDRYPASPDFYHTCYSLCSLSMAVHKITIDPHNLRHIQTERLFKNTKIDVNPIHPLFGVPYDSIQRALSYFDKMEKI